MTERQPQKGYVTSKQSQAWSWRWAVARSDLSAVTRHVLVTLSFFMDEHGGSCFPSTDDLVDTTGLDRKTVLKHLALAADKGWIQVFEHGFGGRRWRHQEYRAQWPTDLDDSDATLPGEGGGGVPPAPADEVVEGLPNGGGRRPPRYVDQSNTSPFEREDARASRRKQTSMTGKEGNDDEEFEADLEALLIASGDLAVISDHRKVREIFSTYSGADRKTAIANFPATMETFKGNGRTKLPSIETILGEERWRYVPSQPIAKEPRARGVAPYSKIALGTPEAKALERLAQVARLGEPRQHTEGGYRMYGSATARLLAMSAASPDEKTWVFISTADKEQMVAWCEFIEGLLGPGAFNTTMAPRFDFPGKQAGFWAPWEWPPEPDGTISDTGQSGPTQNVQASV